MHDYIDSAIILGSKNLDGRLQVASAPGLPFLLQEGIEAHFVPPVIDAPRNARVASVSMQGGGSAIVRFDDVSDVATAEMLIGCHCLVARSDIDEGMLVQSVAEASLYEGWEFVDETSGEKGRITGTDEMPGQTMLLLSIDGEEDRSPMIPLVDEFIASKDDEARFLVLSLPKGILEL